MSIATASQSNTISLSQLSIASPCTADWDAMRGDDRTRHCGECKLNVYNISEMTERDARDLIAKAEGCVCVRMYRRADGTIITKDCPVGLAKIRKHARNAWMKVAAVFALLTGGIALGRVAGDAETSYQPGRDSITDLPGIRQIKQYLRPDPPQMIMGDICIPAPPPAQSATPVPVAMGEIEAIQHDYTAEMGGVRTPTSQR